MEFTASDITDDGAPDLVQAAVPRLARAIAHRCGQCVLTSSTSPSSTVTLRSR